MAVLEKKVFFDIGMINNSNMTFVVINMESRGERRQILIYAGIQPSVKQFATPFAAGMMTVIRGVFVVFNGRLTTLRSLADVPMSIFLYCSWACLERGRQRGTSLVGGGVTGVVTVYVDESPTG
ncbi:hypothetical protein [Williamsia sp. DF01-3]|uniref:hypothetical protein n=1 Tax=Williamsia sp. DF01-3 TaxID=2934157 RepID=UPI001FF1A197|nr:hypothetical protein [Williamsia sp. DF01-3]MCK0515742.1 hypothetical protein [Williamsia sp. DF01-3]